MTFDVGAAADQVLAALRATLGPLGVDETASAKAQAQALAQQTADIGALRTANQISEATAQELLSAAADNAKAALQADLGVAELTAGKAVASGLGVLSPLLSSAAGLGWVLPIIQSLAGQAT